MKKIKNIFINILLPGIILSGFIGFAVGIVIFFYKYTWNLINKNSKFIYEMISNKLILVIPGLLVIIGLAFIQTITIKHVHESRGGGIPTSEGIVRGLLGCRPYSTFIAVIVLSVLLMMEPGEHHALIHSYLLCVELVLTSSIPILNSFMFKEKENKDEALE